MIQGIRPWWREKAYLSPTNDMAHLRGSCTNRTWSPILNQPFESVYSIGWRFSARSRKSAGIPGRGIRRHDLYDEGGMPWACTARVAAAWPNVTGLMADRHLQPARLQGLWRDGGYIAAARAWSMRSVYARVHLYHFVAAVPWAAGARPRPASQGVIYAARGHHQGGAHAPRIAQGRACRSSTMGSHIRPVACRQPGQNAKNASDRSCRISASMCSPSINPTGAAPGNRSRGP